MTPPIKRPERRGSNPNRGLGDSPPPDPLPLSLLNDYLYCPRRAALKALEGFREANEHTILGDLIHEHADLPGYEVAKGVLVWRALPVWSERLGLSGKCDIVEAVASAKRGGRNAEEKSEPRTGGFCKSLVPVEYKKGKRRQFANDDAQLCAQALCLEEMFGITVERGAVFHAESKRRREVEFTAELRMFTEQAIGGLRELIGPAAFESARPMPKAEFKPACEECSLYQVCLPRLTSRPERAARSARALFEISQ